MEIVIADDGSDRETVDAITKYIGKHQEMDIVHVWHPDNGWQKCQILNKAIKASSGDYVIFIDGDCVPHRRFIEDHLRLARKDRAVTGRRVDLLRDISDRLVSGRSIRPLAWRMVTGTLREAIRSGKLNTRNFRQARHAIRIPSGLFLSSGSILGCNFGLWRYMLDAVNGFDERYRHPACGEDADLDLRLRNAGFRIIKTTQMALMAHRCHPRREYYYPENEAIYRASQQARLTATPCGLREAPGSPHA